VSWQFDHLVIAAASLEQGMAWCEATLGVPAGPGGKHPLMSTHNRLLSIASDRFPRAYLEIIAIDPDAPAPGRRRWYDLDEPGLKARIARGPALVHWVARCDDIVAGCAAFAAQGIDRGEVLRVQRDTPRGVLRWRISVRADGQRLGDGAVPTLIEWGDTHPVDGMAASGVVLDELALAAVPAGVAERLPAGVRVGVQGAALVCTLRTPRGVLTLRSPA
jgi:hypothetical protein